MSCYFITLIKIKMFSKATAIMKKKPKTKRNKNKTFFNYGDSSQCPFFPFEFILYSYHSLYGART